MKPLTLILLCLLIGLLTLVTGCTVMQAPLIGTIYSNVKFGTNVGANLGEGLSSATKTGKSCATGVLGFAWGDASIEAAMAAGGISRIYFVDHTNFSLLFVYGEYCTIVKGT